jgi:hypothetical protein
MKSSDIKAFNDCLESMTMDSSQSTASDHISLFETDDLSVTSLIIKQQRQELAKLKHRLEISNFDQKKIEYSHNLNSSLNASPIPRKIATELMDKQKLFNQLNLKFSNLNEDFNSFKDFAYEKEVSSIQQIATLKDLIKSKNLRLKAYESSVQKPPGFSPDDKLNVELKLYKYKVANQEIMIKNLKSQLKESSETKKPCLSMIEQVTPTPPISALNSLRHNVAAQTDTYHPLNSKDVKMIIEKINSVSIDLIESLEMISPQQASEFRSSTNTHSARLESISKVFCIVSKHTKKLMAEVNNLKKKKGRLENDLKKVQIGLAQGKGNNHEDK